MTKLILSFALFLTTPAFAEPKTFASLKEAFADKAELVELSGTRVYSLNAESPLVTLAADSKKPFLVFQINELKEDQTDLVIRTQALSQSLNRVGMSNPKVYILKDKGEVFEVPRKEEAHSSDVGACLKSGYSFEIKPHFKAGMKVIVVNAVSGLTTSMGNVVAGNANFKLKKTNGFCSMVEVYPTLNARYDISLE